jgi:hypothetical protein
MPTTLRDVVRQTLEADTTLTNILTGGIFDASELDYGGESIGQAPKGADGIAIAPHAVIRWRSGNQYGPSKIKADTQTVEMYVYQDTGHDKIEQVLNHLRINYDDRYFTADDRALAHMMFAHIGGEFTADELGGIPGQFARFVVYQVRK